jgi:hypothetical protein
MLGVAALLVAAGCSKPAEQAKQDKPAKQESKAPTKQQANAKPTASTAQETALPAELTATEGLEQACNTLHDVMKQRVESIKQRRGPRPEDKPFPSRETFVSGCKELPPAAVRCMIPDIVRQNHEACVGYFRGLGGEQSKKVSAFRNTLL